MKNLLKYIGLLFIAAFIFVTSCSKDDTNLDYVELPDFEIDTFALNNYFDVFQGDSLKITPTIKYSEGESNLRFYWLSIPSYYQAVQEGNSLVWPDADTLSTERNLAILLTLKPASYNFIFVVEDASNKRRAFEKFHVTINKTLERGLFLLEEIEGGTDVSIIRTTRSLISPAIVIHNYYSTVYGQPLEGKPLFISSVKSYAYPHDYFYIFTDQRGVRLAGDDFFLMEEFNDMFYNTPVYNPQGFMFTDNTQFLVNDGKLHTLDIDKANDRKFSAPIAGNYEASPYFPTSITTTWKPVEDAMQYRTVIYDQLNQKYLPLQPYASKFSQFKSATVDAPFDVNNVDKKLIYAQQGFNYYYFSIFEDESGNRSLYLPKFYNSVDDGNLTEEGGIYDLSGCTDIQNAKYFGMAGSGPVFVYATENAVYSYNYQGSGSSHLLYEFPSNLDITSLLLWRPGGHPFDSRILWIGAYDESAKEGFFYEFEIGPASGELEPNMFGIPVENPEIHDGFGKIVNMMFKL